jgi:hypothetical protein
MINQVVLGGIVFKTWKFTEDLLFRLGKHYPGRKQRPGARHASVGGCR